MVKRITIIFTLFTLSSSMNVVHTQNSKTDSLITVLTTAKEDTNKVNLLLSISSQYYGNDAKLCLDYIYEAKNLSEKLNYRKGVAASLLLAGKYYHPWQEQEDKAIENFFSALKLFEELKDLHNVQECYHRIGTIHWKSGNFEKSLSYFKKGLALNREMHDSSGIAKSLMSIGLVYFEMKNSVQPMKYYNEAMKIAVRINNKVNLAYITGNMGAYYDDIAKQYDTALYYQQLSTKYWAEVGSKGGVAFNGINIGVLYLKKKDYRNAEKVLLESFNYAKEVGWRELMKETSKRLIEVYDSLNNLTKAYLYQKEYIAVSDSLFTSEKLNKVAEVQARFEAEEQEKIRKLEEEKKEARYQAETKQQKIIIYSVSGGLVLMFALAFFIFRGYRQKQKANEIISEQKKLVEEKQKDILDSIHYAKRIQQSLLPTDKYIERSLKRLINEKRISTK